MYTYYVALPFRAEERKLAEFSGLDSGGKQKNNRARNAFALRTREVGRSLGGG
jgi:hypothetical protein